MYDLIIIGIGPAGLSASIYASRYRLKNLVIGKILGGMITMAHKVENYPGFTSISGLELGQKMEEQAKALGGELVYDTVGRIDRNVKCFKIYTESGKEYQGKALILATGTERQRLDIPGEQEYLGRGVSYCTTCDAPFFKDKIVALIGGSDAAVSGAVHTAEFAKKVYIIYRKDKLRAEPIWLEEAERLIKTGKIEVIYNTNITKILGDKDIEQPASGRVAAVELDNPYKDSKYLPIDGVFIEIGSVPGTSLAAALEVKLSKAGFVAVDEQMGTNIAGVFAAGDMTDRSAILPQMITACYQGAQAAASAYKYLKGQQAPKILGV